MDKALVINSYSPNIACLKLFFRCMEKYVGYGYFSNIYLFIDKSSYEPPEYVTPIYYDVNDNFRDQMVFCLSHVKDKVLLYSNEDYLFYDFANLKLADSLVNTLVDSDLSFVKFCHTDLEIYQEYKPKLFLIDKSCENTFSQTLTFWKTEDLLKIHQNCPPSEIGAKGDTFGHLEVAAKQVCRNLNIKGACYYNNEEKRGLCHFDTEVFPHTASALLRGGVWNTSEYANELKKVTEAHNA